MFIISISNLYHRSHNFLYNFIFFFIFIFCHICNIDIQFISCPIIFFNFFFHKTVFSFTNKLFKNIKLVFNIFLAYLKKIRVRELFFKIVFCSQNNNNNNKTYLITRTLSCCQFNVFKKHILIILYYFHLFLKNYFKKVIIQTYIE